ncbi:MAG: hypothetical protein ACOC1K_03140 [Nanoarchaeota archaeon]
MDIQKDKIISKLLAEKMSLEFEIDLFKKTLTDIKKSVYCIGGPLNDNLLKFNDEQLIWICQNIISRIEEVI